MSASQRFRISRRAAANLDKIFEYTAEQFGLAQAERYRVGLGDCFSMIVDFPQIGRQSDTIRRGLRRHEHGSHIILYKENPDHVLIVAVVHGRSIKRLKR